MKLLYCMECDSVFNLGLELRTCNCGKVKGRYINHIEAEVNGEGYSLAIGNGSLMQALVHLPTMKDDSFRQVDPWQRHPTTVIAWARPHEGPANPHTKVNPEL